jgi:hypothetical protein
MKNNGIECQEYRMEVLRECTITMNTQMQFHNNTAVIVTAFPNEQECNISSLYHITAVPRMYYLYHQPLLEEMVINTTVLNIIENIGQYISIY